MTDIQVVESIEAARHCGYRTPGKTGVGIYLMGDGIEVPCQRLPYPLHICPTCGGGIKFSRAFTWIDPIELFSKGRTDGRECPQIAGERQLSECRTCPMNPDNCHPKAGLLWVGEKFYTPQEFLAESKMMGISKRVPAVPRGLKIGTHRIYLAHVRGYYGRGDTEASAGIFMVFKPTHVDLVIGTDEVPERARSIYESLPEEACRVVRVVPQPDAQEDLFDGGDGKEVADG